LNEWLAIETIKKTSVFGETIGPPADNE
jgi:hypothetical protein